MQLLNLSETVNFMSLRRITSAFSILLIVASIASFATKGLNWGLDFTGGSLIEVSFEQSADLTKVRQVMDENGFGDATVQNFGSSRDVLIRIAPRLHAEGESVGEKIDSKMIGDTIMSALTAMDDTATMRRIEFVGPSVGGELREQGGLAMLTALLCILIYVALRFEWRFALGSVSALGHDVIITVGLFSALGIEFDLTVLAAVLAVIGYSLNDTIVVSDRIRENFRKIRQGEAEEIINISLTQTLNRTMVTSFTTALVLLALLFVGGELIKGFATALLFGVVIGTYSSIYVASSIALALGISKEDMMPTEVEKEGADQDQLMP
ncbi:protein translocase subunit SecF [Psychrosphaera sp. B3R10]|uniref:protein translocase subunit SecF n=1 Tax=unclassified Psychrosphaera TaxID=2641570 RepID=UPI001C0917C6|nr:MULTISPECIES: protein translocase subunit SecF [unclassified Psychrosphaera]MBU2882944.1 protein translocase subunit SecF [Psychrosphaera sp. I2R16]MBU2991341.1 protein translocase subunit SecF [Psychrosphaera sp. B3R10]MDO6720230.1 protein translocase subunit SecF [Psychrosphaera sp. 1_MG-2023]